MRIYASLRPLRSSLTPASTGLIFTASQARWLVAGVVCLLYLSAAPSALADTSASPPPACKVVTLSPPATTSITIKATAGTPCSGEVKSDLVLNATYTLATPPKLGSAVLNPDGTFTYTADSDAVKQNTPSSNDDFAIARKTGSNSSVSTAVHVEIDPVMPVYLQGSYFYTLTNKLYAGQLDGLAPAGATFSITPSAAGNVGKITMVDSSTGRFVYFSTTATPGATPDKFDYSITAAGETSAPHSVTIAAVAAAPTTVPSYTIDVFAGIPYKGQLRGIGSDGQVFSIVHGASPQGSIVLDDPITGTYTYTANSNTGTASATDTFTYGLADPGVTPTTFGTVTVAIHPAPPAANSASTTTLSSFVSKGGWGAGISLVVNDGKLISNAAIINNRVRVLSEQKAQTELVVAYHWYFAEPTTDNPGGWRCTKTLFNACEGAFIALGAATGTSSTSQSFPDLAAIGYLLGWGNNDPKTIQSQPFNFGIGMGYRFAVSTLGDGFVPNQAPPAGESTVRYETKDTWAYLIFFTYAFGQSTLN